MGPRHRTKGGSTGSNQLQSYSHNQRGRQGAQEVHQGTTGKRVYSEIQIPLHVSILLYQEERWETTTYTGLPKAESIHHLK